MKNDIKIIFFSFFLFNSPDSFSVGPSDSLKRLYDINDPRNHDCPCHKYQKLAEKEYEKLLKKEEVVLSVNKSRSVKTESNGKIKPARFKRRSLRMSSSKVHKLKSTNKRKPDFFRIFKKDIARCHIA
jgi:hypothetical protein